jgi:predicted anti-sigma-YlaC factor YlaD
MAHDPEECKRIFALLSEYLDLELPPDACEHIEEHLRGCPPCVDFAESLRKTVDLCRQYTPETMPPPLSKSAQGELWSAWRKAVGHSDRS